MKKLICHTLVPRSVDKQFLALILLSDDARDIQDLITAFMKLQTLNKEKWKCENVNVMQFIM